MSAPFLALRTPMPMLTWWQGKSRRERRIVRLLVVLVSIVVFWAGIWQPLQRDAHRLRLEREHEAAALVQARSDVDEMARLQRTPAPAMTDVRMNLERSLASSGLRNAVTDLQWQQRRARVTFAAVEFAAMMKWLETLQREGGIILQEATLSARVEPGSVRAELVLGM
jgi:general secretion pathway protein M